MRDVDEEEFHRRLDRLDGLMGRLEATVEDKGSMVLRAIRHQLTLIGKPGRPHLMVGVCSCGWARDGTDSDALADLHQVHVDADMRPALF